MNKDKVLPYFQPIISADEQLVIGYESLARIDTEEGTKSLGWFFLDKSIPDEYRQELDDHLQTLALEKLLEFTDQPLLFMNVDLTILVQDNAESLLVKLQEYKAKGIELNQIVLEIKEEEIIKDVSSTKHLLSYIQSLGILIAVDDVGKNASNLEHLVQIKPDIVKVDLGFLEGDAFLQLYRDVLYSITMLTRKIGATLLFEGIKEFGQLNYAWRNGGRYYQGYYLGSPKKEIGNTLPAISLKKEFHHFINFERKKIEAQYTLTDQLGQKLKNILKTVKVSENYDDAVLQVGKACQDFTFRIYICDQDGFQQSANAIKTNEGKFVLEHEGRFKNWSWRPYFLENIVRMNYERKGILSDLYTDIEKEEIIRTYAYPIDENLFIFLDIPYQYLFEQDGLL